MRARNSKSPCVFGVFPTPAREFVAFMVWVLVGA